MQVRNQPWAGYAGGLGVALIVAAFLLNVVFGLPVAALLLLVGIGIVLIAVYLFTRPRAELREAVTGRRTLYGSNALLLSVAFIGIIALINFIVVHQFPGARLDLTEGQQRTLSPQTVKVVQSLQDPIQVTGFFTPQNIQQQIAAESELKDYQAVSSKITYRFVDPQTNPALARSYDIVQDGTLVFEHGTRKEKVYSPFDENTFTNSILKVTQTQQPAIYFTTGHGELDPSNSQPNGLSGVQTYLQQTNYKVDKLNMSAISATNTISGGLPADTSAVVIADATKPFASQDEQKLKQYLDSGGRILILADPQTDPGLKDLLQTWGMQLNNDLVLDPAQGHNYRGISAYPAFVSFPTHAVTQDLSSYGVFFPGARSVKKVQRTDKNLTELFTTSDQSCGKTDFAALQNEQQLSCDPAKDEKGPFVLGYAVEGTAPAGGKNAPRLVVIGNSQFASNQVLQSQDGQGNALLVQNVINWLAGQEQLIAVPAKTPGQHPLKATTGTDAAFIMVSDVGLIPLTILIIGALIWWRRR